MLSRAARLLARRAACAPRCLSAGAAAPAEAKALDWGELQAFVSGDDAKREVALLKKQLDDARGLLEAQAKARLRRSGRRVACAAAAAECSCSHARTPRQPVAPIDFDYFRKNLSGAPGLVDEFEKAYKGAGASGGGARPPAPRSRPTPPRPPPPSPRSALKLPEYDGDEEAELDAAHAALVGEVKEAEAAAHVAIAALEAQLVALRAEKAALRTLTVDDVLAADPTLKAKARDKKGCGAGVGWEAGCASGSPRPARVLT